MPIGDFNERLKQTDSEKDDKRILCVVVVFNIRKFIP